MGDVEPRRAAFAEVPASVPLPRANSHQGTSSRPSSRAGGGRPLSARGTAFQRGSASRPTPASAPKSAGQHRVAFSATAEVDGFTSAPITYNIPIFVTHSSKKQRSHSAVVRSQPRHAPRSVRRGTSARASGPPPPAPPAASQAPKAVQQLLDVDREMLQWEASLAAQAAPSGAQGVSSPGAASEGGRVPPMSPITGALRGQATEAAEMHQFTVPPQPLARVWQGRGGVSPTSQAWDMALQTGAERGFLAAPPVLAPPAQRAAERDDSWGSFVSGSDSEGGDGRQRSATPTRRADRLPLFPTPLKVPQPAVEHTRRRATSSNLTDDFLVLFAPVTEEEGEASRTPGAAASSPGGEEAFELSGVIEDNTGGVLHGIDTSWGEPSGDCQDDDGVVEVVYDAAAQAQLGCQSTVQVVFITPQGERIKATGEKGSTVLEVALDHGVDIEGACGGECACSTCHVIVQDQAKFDMLPPIELEEEDMLDLAAELEDT
ncbi:Fdx2 [Symbiodinium sp. KB8]|nr:Fdx2 [Symbiodinium sp. KB8]